MLKFAIYSISLIKSGSQINVIYTDFQKAFDRVSNIILVRKVYDIGVKVNERLIDWIRSYLSGRSQYIKVLGHMTRLFEVKSAVPQGSHLGQLLFRIFMDDVTRVFRSIKLLYADDLKLFSVVNCILDATNLQFDLNALFN